ncbi:hypothetical protein D3C80_1902120 [compost metagenome]
MMPLEIRLPPLWVIFPVSVPPCLTSREPVVSLLVHTTSGVSSVMRVLAVQRTSGAVTSTFCEALITAVLMPVTFSALVFGSYSKMAPSGKAR